MNQPTPIAPPITTVSAIGERGPRPATAGTATLTVEPHQLTPQLGPITQPFPASLTISGFTMPTTPAPTAAAWNKQTLNHPFAMPPNTIAQGNLLLPWRSC